VSGPGRRQKWWSGSGTARARRCGGRCRSGGETGDIARSGESADIQNTHHLRGLGKTLRFGVGERAVGGWRLERECGSGESAAGSIVAQHTQCAIAISSRNALLLALASNGAPICGAPLVTLDLFITQSHN
jgi:hypothetical protein